jgi:hypothetical protein
MKPERSLQNRLRSAARRVRWLITIQWTVRSLFWTTLVCTIWLLMARFGWTVEPKFSTLVGLCTAAGLTGLLFGATRKVSLMDVARLTETRTDLKERLSTAVEIHQLGKDSPMAQAQIADAGEHLQGLNLRRVFPFRIAREMIGLVILMITLAVIFFLPTAPLFWSKERKQEMEEVKRQGIALEKIAREQEKRASAQNLSESRRVAQEIKRLAEAMRQGEVNKKETMIQIQRLTREIEERQRRLASVNTPERKSLEQAAQEAKQALQQRQKQIEEAIQAKALQEKENQRKPSEQLSGPKQQNQSGQNSLAEKRRPSEAMQQSQQALNDFAHAMEKQDANAQNQALQTLAEQMQKGQMSQQEMQLLQRQIQDMANVLEGTRQDAVSKELQQIAHQMQEGRLDPQTMREIVEAMKRAGQTCQSSQQQAMEAKQLQELAKALREGKLNLAQGEPDRRLNLSGKRKGATAQELPGQGYSPFGHVNNPRPEKRAGRVDANRPDTKIKGQRGKSSGDPTITYRGDPERGVKSDIPYYQVYTQQRSMSENPVNRENIPASYRKQVKDYFESINP